MPQTPAQPEPTAGPSLRRVAVLGLLALAELQLLACHLGPFAPVRQNFGRDMPLARNAAAQATLEAQLVRLTGGRPVQLHFVERPPTPDTGMTACGLYYGMNYALFPLRAYLGDGRRLVNDTATIRAADRVPPDADLRARGMAAVVSVGIGPQGIDTHVRPLVAPPVPSRATTRP